MPRTIQAIYENGVLKPLSKLDLPEQQRVDILIKGSNLGYKYEAFTGSWLLVHLPVSW